MDKAPSQQFLDELVNHSQFVLNCCLKLCSDKSDAEDLRQDVLMKAMRFHEGFLDGTNMKGWLVRITKNTFINNYRKKSKNSETLIEDINDLCVDAFCEEIDLFSNPAPEDQGGLSEELVSAVESLDPEYKNIVILIDIYGYNYREVAEFKSIPEGTIKSRLFRARGILREKLLDRAKTYGINYVKKKSNRKKIDNE